jgi:hypothetical protein
MSTSVGRIASCCFVFSALLIAAANSSAANSVAYQVPAGVVGNQSDGANVSFGMDFNVVSPITVSGLGVFDSSQDGLLAPIAVAIYDRTTQTPVTSVVNFAAGTGPTSGSLVGGSRFLIISQITLPAGFQGAIITYGYGNGVSAELDGNSFGAATGTPTFPWTVDTGGGLISFVGSGRYSGGGGAIQYPVNIDSGPANRYAAGTFIFSAVPEPSTFVLASFAAVMGISVRRLRRS